MTELRPREDAAVKAHQRDPFRVLAGPSERFQLAISSPQVRDHLLISVPRTVQKNDGFSPVNRSGGLWENGPNGLGGSMSGEMIAIVAMGVALVTNNSTITVPGAPTRLIATANGQTIINLYWTTPVSNGGSPITGYRIEIFPNGVFNWTTLVADTTGTGTSVPGGGGTDPPGGGGGGGGPRQTVPSAPRNLLAEGGDGQVKLTWEAPENDGGSEIRDYEYRINRRNPWISIGSTDTAHTVTGLVNGTEYVFEVRAVNRNRRGRASNRAEATPEAPEVFTLDFAHFANGTSITSDLVLVNVAPQPVRPAIYFYDTEGNPIAAESVVDITGDLEITEDGALTVQTEMEPLGVLTISTHGRGGLVSGSARVVSDGPIGGMLRFEHPALGVAGVGASPPLSDALFPVRRQEGGINTGVALHNLESSPGLLRCDLMREGVLLDAASIPLEANGQTAWLIDQAFPGADTSDFAGSVRCDAVGEGLFSAVALEMDPGNRIFTTLPVVPVPERMDRE